MTEKITVNADGTATISKTTTVIEKITKEDVQRAIADITLELNKVQARLDYQKALLAKLGG